MCVWTVVASVWNHDRHHVTILGCTSVDIGSERIKKSILLLQVKEQEVVYNLHSRLDSLFSLICQTKQAFWRCPLGLRKTVICHHLTFYRLKNELINRLTD